jgi:hypothetical protein
MDALASADQPAKPQAEYRHLQSSRYDLVKGTTTDEMIALQDFIATRPPSVAETWWKGLLFSDRSQTPPGVPPPPASAMQPVARFRAVPDPKVPLSGEGAALSAPLFLQNCRSFTVEYAGDFVTQLTDVRGNGADTRLDPNLPDGEITMDDMADPRYGQVVAAEPDGRIDFYTVSTGRTTPWGPECVERVRFYGLPRDADGRGAIPGAVSGRLTNELGAVVPLRDVVRTGAAANPALASFDRAEFERQVTFAPHTDYAAPGAVPPDAAYTCVWGPGQPRPKMIRIIVTLEDPENRLGVGQTYEYVFEVGW